MGGSSHSSQQKLRQNYKLSFAPGNGSGPVAITKRNEIRKVNVRRDSIYHDDLFLVFLTNRAFDPKARDSLKGLKAIRTSLSDAAIRLVPHACKQELVANC